MMTDRLFHHGAYKALQLHAKKSDTYFYLFSMVTNNILPVIDPAWSPIDPRVLSRGLDGAPPGIGPEGSMLGISHGDDVRQLKLLRILSTFSIFSGFSHLFQH